MHTFQILSDIQITNDDRIKLNSVTCDGEYFYFTELKNNKIYKYSFDLELIRCYETKRKYRSMCYDKKDDCFWACIDKSCVIKLNHDFKEIDMFTIKCYEKQFGQIKGIKYNFNKNKLLIAYSTVIIEVNKSENTGISIKQKERGTYYYSALELDDCYICSYTRNDFPAISVFDNDDKLVIQCCLSVEYYIHDMMLYFDKHCKEQFIYVLASKQGYHSCFIKCRFVDSKENLENSDCSGDCHDNESQNKECHSKEQHDKNFSHNSCFNIGDKENNDQHCNCETDYVHEDSYTHAIESVAILQKSLANILNTEAEKIQKILTCSDSADEILKINDTIGKNISKVLQLELFVFSMLDSLNEMIKKY